MVMFCPASVPLLLNTIFHDECLDLDGFQTTGWHCFAIRPL